MESLNYETRKRRQNEIYSLHAAVKLEFIAHLTYAVKPHPAVNNKKPILKFRATKFAGFAFFIKMN